MGKKIMTQHLTGLVRTRPTMIITTVHEDGTVNGGTFGAYTNVGPSEIGIAIGMGSHTYKNLKRTGEFVINVPSAEHARALEICGQRIAPDQSEIELAGLHCDPARELTVPIIRECISNIECRFWKEIEIDVHSFVIGKAVCGHLDERFVDTDGVLDVVKSCVVFNIRYPEPIYASLANPVTVDVSRP